MKLVFFRRSQQTRKYIDEEKRIERLIIPIALLGEIPATLSDIEGIGIAKTDRFLFDLNTVGNGQDQKENDRFFELLTRFDRILDTLDPVERTGEQQLEAYEGYCDKSKCFYQDLLKLMSSLALSMEFPKTRLTIRLPSDFSSKDIEIDHRFLFSCSGPTAEIFEQQCSEGWVPWPDFAKRIGPDDVALSWNDALRSLVASTLAGDFADSDQLVFSFDQNKLFRLFISKSTTFFDRTREIDIYVVEILRCKDAGDPFTTFLAKAIAIALRYRSLFLESGSPYGPVAIRLRMKNDWKPTIRQLLRELRLLLMQSREAGLGQTQHIVELYGSDEKSVNNVLAMMATWLNQKAKLYQSAAAVLAQSEPTDATFDAFVSTLSEFCAKTKDINATFTTTVVQQLQRVLKEG